MADDTVKTPTRSAKNGPTPEPVMADSSCAPVTLYMRSRVVTLTSSVALTPRFKPKRLVYMASFFTVWAGTCAAKFDNPPIMAALAPRNALAALKVVACFMALEKVIKAPSCPCQKAAPGAALLKKLD